MTAFNIARWLLSLALVVFAIRHYRRVARALAELERREQARLAADAKARQRDAVQQMVIDFDENCRVAAFATKRGGAS